METVPEILARIETLQDRLYNAVHAWGQFAEEDPRKDAARRKISDIRRDLESARETLAFRRKYGN